MKIPRATRMRLFAICGILAATALPLSSRAADDATAGEEWHSLFNGRNLEGWTPKIAKHPLGENFGNVFRVEDGILKVSYDQYSKFEMQFGHLFTNNAYSSYVLRLEYRFTGSSLADAPTWARLNSGIMIHCQSPLSMHVEQGFPVSVEFQLLAAGATAGTQTGNAATPGTNIVLNGQLTTDHIIDSSSELFPLDEWIAAEVEVHGNELVIQRINGVEVLRYTQPQLDPRDPDAQALLAAGVPLQLDSGFIALQAESQPVWFRNIMIRSLD